MVKCLSGCLIHACHSSFQKGLTKCGYNAEELCLSLFYFFKRTSCTRKYLFEINESLGLDELVLLYHVQNHWLSLLPGLQYVAAIKSAPKKLLPEKLPKMTKALPTMTSTLQSRRLWIQEKLKLILNSL